MFGKGPPRPPFGTPIGKRQRETLGLVADLTRRRGSRGTTWTGGGPTDIPAKLGLIVAYAQPTGVIPKATGTWPDLTPGSGGDDVFQNISGSLVQIGTDATLYNWGTDDTTAGYRLIVSSNGDGTWDIIGQFCQRTIMASYTREAVGDCCCGGTPPNPCPGSAPPGYVCCDTCPIPISMSLTDANGTWAFTYSSGTWTANYNLSVTNAIITYSAVGCGVVTTGNGSTPIGYVGACVQVGGVYQFRVTQNWYAAWVAKFKSTGAKQLSNPVGFPGPCSACNLTSLYDCECDFLDTSLVAILGGLTGQTITALWSSCAPFAWSQNFPNPAPYGSLGTICTPIGGTVAIS